MDTAVGKALTCREAQLILRVMDIDKPFDRLSDEERAALAHYGDLQPFCVDCHELGLARITGTSLDCRQAIMAWVRRDDHALLQLNQVRSLRDCLAREHVYGRMRAVDGRSVDYLNSCQFHACRTVAACWHDAHLSAFYDGDRETAMFIPLCLLTFRQEGWPLEDLLKSQAEMFERRLQQLEHEPGASLPRHELNANWSALQVMALPDWETRLAHLVGW